MSARTILWTTTDPRGLTVSCAEDVWLEHVRKHPEIADYFDEVQLTVQDPDEIYFDPVSSAQRPSGTSIFSYYKLDLGRGKFKGDYIVVVVKSIQEARGPWGYVQSILLSDRVMKRLILEWKK
jgi:hypothetical protein